MKNYGLIALMISALPAAAQYAPQAGIAGSTAIHKSSSEFVGWANGCTVTRGLRQISLPDSGYVTLGTEASAVGFPDGDVMSLGDHGSAVLTFTQAIENGAGPDFAVFENGFANPANPEDAFLELAFVEVSSDGVNYMRFPASSLTQTTAQIAGAGDYMLASQVDGLAGKYVAQYGVPFDLELLSGTPGLDINHITHVRIVDCIGAIGSEGTKDKDNNVINDPYPTNFPSGGFDLDGVGVIHQAPLGIGNTSLAVVNIYPNPAADYISVSGVAPAQYPLQAAITDVTGRVVARQMLINTADRIDVTSVQAGIYTITFKHEQHCLGTVRLLRW